MVERTTPKIPIELAWDEYVASMEGRLHGQTDAFKFAWKAAKKEWVGLTEEEIDQSLLRSNHALQTAVAWRDGVEWAIKQLKEKNT